MGQQAEGVKSYLEPFNKLPIFNNTLKMSTLQSKWHNVQKKVESFRVGRSVLFDWSKTVGGRCLSWMSSTLPCDLARKMDKYKDKEAVLFRSKADSCINPASYGYTLLHTYPLLRPALQQLQVCWEPMWLRRAKPTRWTEWHVGKQSKSGEQQLECW